MATLLIHHLAEHQYLREQLQAEYLEADEDTLRDTLEGLSSLPEAIANVIRILSRRSRRRRGVGHPHLRHAGAVVSYRTTGGEETRGRVRGDGTGRSEETRRTRLHRLAACGAAGLVVNDESEIPENFWKPQAPKLDRRRLIAALTAGQAVQGASLGNGGVTLSVRTK